MRTVFFDGTIRDYQLIVPDFGTLAGPFQITALDYAGEHDGAITYEIALESAGPDQLRGRLMANRRRGEIEAVLDGEPRVLVLTLGALAELEAAFGAGDLAALAARFADGQASSARDAARIIGAGLRAAGTDDFRR